MTKKYLYCVDAAHGWLRVKREELKRLEIAEKSRGESYETFQKYRERSCVRDNKAE